MKRSRRRNVGQRGSALLTLNDDASLVAVDALRVGGFALVNALVVEGQVRQDEGRTFSAGTHFGRHQSVHLPPTQGRDGTDRQTEEGLKGGQRVEGGGAAPGDGQQREVKRRRDVLPVGETLQLCRVSGQSVGFCWESNFDARG